MLKAALIALTTSYIAWFLQAHERQVVYPFDARHTAPAAAGEARLAEMPLATPDGERLVTWIAAPEPGRPVVLYFPGNAGTLADRAPRFRALLDRGFGLAALAWRGSSGSSGKPDEARLTADAHQLAAALDTLLPGAAAAPRLLYGESLGAAVAIKLAAAGRGDAVVLEAPFTSIPDLIAAQYPQEDLSAHVTQLWNSRAHVAGLSQPLLVLHGTEDRLVPLAQGREIYERAGADRKRFLAVERAGHAGLWNDGAARAALFAFLEGPGRAPQASAATSSR